MIAIAILVPKIIPDDIRGDKVWEDRSTLRWIIRGGCIIIAFVCFLATSCVIINPDKVGHLKRVYFGRQMPAGRIIAAPNEKGPQARILAPGFQLLPFIRVTHTIEELPLVHVNQGEYGFLVAKDGRPMPEGQFIAPAWEKLGDMINAMKFMGYDGKKIVEPRGIKGPQLTVLPPGDYRINRYLFQPLADASTPVPVGSVAVIKSNVGEDYTGDPILPSGIKTTDLSVPIVPKGYRGVWKDVYTPGEYYINKRAYNVTIIPTRVQTWKYLGGYTRKWIDLVIGDDGKIHQEPHEEFIKVPKDAADNAIVLRVEGWDVFQDSRVQVQVTPQNAPFVVAAVGGVQQIEDKIITPNYRSILRNVVAQEVPYKEIVDGKEVVKKRPRHVLDLLYHREEIEQAVAKELIPAGAQAGLTVQWVRLGDPAVPPSLLLPEKRKQLAERLIATYKHEKEAQIERVKTERERARADQQGTLMKSEIGITVAENQATARRKAGRGEEDYLKAVARGQLAQANVLGKDKAFELAYIKEVLAAASANPEMIKFPTTFVMGENGNGLTGAAAILGASNLSLGLANQK